MASRLRTVSAAARPPMGASCRNEWHVEGMWGTGGARACRATGMHLQSPIRFGERLMGIHALELIAAASAGEGFVLAIACKLSFSLQRRYGQLLYRDVRPDIWRSPARMVQSTPLHS